MDGKVIVKDENGTQSPIEYYDNLDEVLIQENLIESMENKIAHLEKELQEYKKNNKRRYIPIVLPIVIATLGAPAIFYMLGDVDVFVTSIDTIFGTVNKALFYSDFFSVLFLPYASLMEFSLYRKHKHLLNDEKGIESALESLKKQIIIEREKIVDLKKEKN